jgi:O-antigen ligase
MVKKLWLWMVLFSAVVVFVPARGIDMMHGKFLAWTLAVTLFLPGVAVESRWLKLFMVWAGVRLAMGPITSAGFSTVYTICLVIMCFQFMVNIFREYGARSTLNIVCWLALVQVAMLTAQNCGYWLLLIPNNLAHTAIIPNLLVKSGAKYAICGFIGNPNMSGALLAVCMPAFFRNRWWWGLPLVFWGIHLSASLGGTIPALTAFALFGILKWAETDKLPIFLFLMFLFGVSFIVYIANAQYGGLPQFFGIRWLVWEDTWKFIVRHPIVGYGVGTFKQLYPQISAKSISECFGHAHNEYLQLWFEMGLIGMVSMAGFIGATLRHGMKLRANKDGDVNHLIVLGLCGLSAGLLNSIVNFPMHNSIGIFIVLWAAVIYSQKGAK